jgi:hypothetical protein
MQPDPYGAHQPHNPMAGAPVPPQVTPGVPAASPATAFPSGAVATTYNNAYLNAVATGSTPAQAMVIAQAAIAPYL